MSELVTAGINKQTNKQWIERDESKIMPRFWDCVNGSKGQFHWPLNAGMEVAVTVAWSRREWVLFGGIELNVLVQYPKLKSGAYLRIWGYHRSDKCGERIEFKNSHSSGQSGVSDIQFLRTTPNAASSLNISLISFFKWLFYLNTFILKGNFVLVL